jgi:hypothetical protein
MPTNPFFE